MKRNRLFAWVVMAVCAIYFLTPLLCTFEFSLRLKRGVYSIAAYENVFRDSRFQESFVY